ncbi:GNAT family protein [Crenobacter sp. SG2305]|uniref:GNAT family N-acetyltransferase n=1 Tax=Crenobacter oryzisoli TaxID=3056844 RepID=UPI0025AB047E|nr:GNAT family protein [Crenobacter sp. SG2305]MDN0083680.1 GNAT family protein [Crenobacter sp. SG2305]
MIEMLEPPPDSLYRDDELEVRMLVLSDAPSLFEAVRASRTEIGEWESWCTPEYRLEHSFTYLLTSATNRRVGLDYDYGLIDRANGKVIGCVAINQINRVHQFANLGYWVHSDYTGRGLAGRAAWALARFGFAELGLFRLEIVVELGNSRSRRVAEKLGAKLEGVGRWRLNYRGEPCDAWLFSLLPGDVA